MSDWKFGDTLRDLDGGLQYMFITHATACDGHGGGECYVLASLFDPNAYPANTDMRPDETDDDPEQVAHYAADGWIRDEGR